MSSVDGGARTPRNPLLYYPANSVGGRFGRKLKRLRERENWTQAQMAKRLGVDRTHLSDIERGRKMPSLIMLEVIALGFGMTLSDLLEDIDRDGPAETKAVSGNYFVGKRQSTTK